jgi:hypothetical protein
MLNKAFIVQTLYDGAPMRVQAANPRAALATVLASGMVGSIRYCLDADLYVEAGLDDDWDFSVCEPLAGTSADHVYFAVN